MLLPLLVGAAASANVPPLARWARDPPPQKHLFVDAALFANVSGDALLVRHAPQPADVPLRPDQPWETFGFIGYHTASMSGSTSRRRSFSRTSSRKWRPPASRPASILTAIMEPDDVTCRS